MADIRQPYLFPKLLSGSGFTLKPERLNFWQISIFAAAVIVSIAVKIYLIPFSIMETNIPVINVWSAYWWAENPFFVLPDGGYPLWLYFMGPLLKITGEMFLTPAFAMIILISIACIYVFKITLMLSDFKTALLAFFIAALNPVIFRLNFEPGGEQIFLAALCIMIYYFIRALASDKSVMYFIITGIFSFIALASAPEAIFVIVPMCTLAFITRRNGCCYYIGLSLLFPIIWFTASYALYGNSFRSFTSVFQNANFESLSPGLKIKGFFLPYYFLILGLTIIMFYYFLKGIIFLYKGYPKVFFVALLTPILATATAGGIAGIVSESFHTTRLIYLMFLISPVITALGLNSDLSKIRFSILQGAFASVVILSCIPLSYMRDFLPEKYGTIFSKELEFIAAPNTSDDSARLVDFIVNNIRQYPALIFDADQSAPGIFYVPYCTKFAPPEKLLISGYNEPADKEYLTGEIKSFFKKNPKGIIMFRKDANTVMNKIFTQLTAPKHYIRNDMTKTLETDKWIVYIYHPPVEIK
ncbi:MAG: glycosyltransferase family 39 protein [Ignavibacteria bacterium]